MFSISHNFLIYYCFIILDLRMILHILKTVLYILSYSQKAQKTTNKANIDFYQEHSNNQS